MNTLTIEFEDSSMVSVIRNLIKSMKGVHIVSTMRDKDLAEHSEKQKDARYKISPKIKALEVGTSLPDDISDDYKQEMAEIKTKA